MRSFSRLLWILWGSVSAVTVVALVMLLGPLSQPSLGHRIDLDAPAPSRAVTLTEAPTPPTSAPSETPTAPPAAPSPVPARTTPTASVVPPKPAAPSRVAVSGCDDDCDEWDDDDWDDTEPDDEWDDDLDDD